jgi:hypothetical protein
LSHASKGRYERIALKKRNIRQKYGPDHTHLLFRTLLLDNAGEQSDNNAEFNAAMDGLTGGSCERIYSDPTREKSKSAAELAVKALELRMKGIMLESSLPVTFWKLAYGEAIEISNMYPITKNIASRDGDAIRPLEEISNGRISRQFINKMLKYFVLLAAYASADIDQQNQGFRRTELRS